MPYSSSPFSRPPRPLRRRDPAPDLPPAVAAVMRAELDAKEYGITGECAVVRPVEPQLPGAERISIPPPDWGPPIGPPPTPQQPADLGAQALAELREQEGDDERPPLGPPISEWSPLLPVKIPPPQWREEQP